MPQIYATYIYIRKFTAKYCIKATLFFQNYGKMIILFYFSVFASLATCEIFLCASMMMAWVIAFFYRVMAVNIINMAVDAKQNRAKKYMRIHECGLTNVNCLP